MDSQHAPTQSGAPSVRPAHPERLTRLDGPYLVPWGRAEMVRITSWVLIPVAGVAVLGGFLSPLVLWLELPLAIFLGVCVLFFRNPRRRVPTEPGVLVSPADGKVVEVELVPAAEFLDGPALKIGIFLSIFNVHVNRAPGSGTVEHLEYRPGKFLDARNPRCSVENESQAIGMRLDRASDAGDADRVLVRQISGAIARHIVCPLEKGESLERGGLIGMIKYGSRTELYVPARDGEAGWSAAVRVGQTVRGGESVLFRWGGGEAKNQSAEG